MINLQVDEAFALDYLSILEVKKNKLPSPQNTRAFEKCKADLNWEFYRLDYGEAKFLEILQSEDYSKLLDINSKVFEAVDKARYGTEKDISAKEVDSLNMERFRLKQIIQNKYFKIPTQEVKN